MAKKSSIEKNKRRARSAAKARNKRSKLKAILMNKDLPGDERFAASQKLAELPRDGSVTRVRNRCELTGRPRAFYRKFKLSRIAMRELASQGQLPGVVKSSW